MHKDQIFNISFKKILHEHFILLITFRVSTRKHLNYNMMKIILAIFAAFLILVTRAKPNPKTFLFEARPHGPGKPRFHIQKIG